MHRNPNVRYEYFMRGILASFEKIKYYDIPAHVKKDIAKTCLDWQYSKSSSKKAFLKALASSSLLEERIKGWKCYHFSFKEMKLTTFADLYAQKKYDDFLDTIILLESPSYYLKRQAKKAKDCDLESKSSLNGHAIAL